MKRRTFIQTILGGLASTALPAAAKPATPNIGVDLAKPDTDTCAIHIIKGQERDLYPLSNFPELWNEKAMDRWYEAMMKERAEDDDLFQDIFDARKIMDDADAPFIFEEDLEPGAAVANFGVGIPSHPDVLRSQKQAK